MGYLGSASKHPMIANGVALLAYLKRDPSALEFLLGHLAGSNLDFPLQLAMLQTALTIDGSVEKIEKALAGLPPLRTGGEPMIRDAWRVLVQGRPGLRPVAEKSPLSFLSLAQARDRKGMIDALPLLLNSYASWRPILEIAANRSLPHPEDALAWSREAVPSPVEKAIESELKALAYEDVRKALRDERLFVRANATWLLNRRSGRLTVSRGPWLREDPSGTPTSVIWTLPGPSLQEVESLEK